MAIPAKDKSKVEINSQGYKQFTEGLETLSRKCIFMRFNAQQKNFTKQTARQERLNET
jgi:hypothetical protein